MFIRYFKIKILILAIPLLSIIGTSCSFNRAFFKNEYSVINLPDSVSYERIKIKSKSGENLSAIFFKPSGKPKATIFLVKGNSGNISSWYDLISIMLKNNYQVATFDYEGMGESEGKATHKNVVRDSELVLKNIRKREDVKENKLILWGFSFGGNLAVKIAYDNPGVFDLLVLEATFTSQRKIAIKKLPWILKPVAFFTGYSPYTSKHLISEIRNLPVLVVHSVEDKQIPYKMGVRIYNKANEPKIFFEVLGGHCDALKLYEEDYFFKLEKLLNASRK